MPPSVRRATCHRSLTQGTQAPSLQTKKSKGSLLSFKSMRVDADATPMRRRLKSNKVARPYPYKWFTPVAVVGAIILVVLLSIMNFIQNSYVLVVEYADNPNSTIANGTWYSDWPSYLTRSVRPTCEPANLPVNTQFYTNQSGLMWTLQSVVQEDSHLSVSPSLPYMNNVLEQCEIHEIQMLFEPSQLVQVLVGQITSSTDVQVRAFVTCSIWGPEGHTKLNISAMYDTISPDTIAGSSSFVGRNATSRASLYWAEALLSAYWLQTAVAATAAVGNLTPYAQKGMAILYPSRTQSDIRSLDFFDLTYTVLTTKGDHPFQLIPEVGFFNTVKHYIQTNGQNSPSLLPWQQADGLAKSMYSAVLADLGQTTVSSQTNIVTNATTLQHFTTNFTDIKWLTQDSHLPEMLGWDYNTVQNGPHPTGSLGLTPSVISTKYLCQVPRRKPLGDIIISVLLADLVLLQAAWKIYTLVIDQVLVRRQSSAKHCEGCLDDEKEQMMRELIAKEVVLALRCTKGGILTSTQQLRQGTGFIKLPVKG